MVGSFKAVNVLPTSMAVVVVMALTVTKGGMAAMTGTSTLFLAKPKVTFSNCYFVIILFYVLVPTYSIYFFSVLLF